MKKVLAILVASMMFSCAACAMATPSKTGNDIAASAADQSSDAGVEELLASAASQADSGWTLVEASDISNAGKTGSVTIKTVMPFSAGDEIMAKIGSLVDGNIKWVETNATINSDGSVTVNLDGKVDSNATSVVVAIYKKL